MSINPKTIKFINSNKGYIFTAIGMVGVGVTSALSFRAGIKAAEMIQNGEIYKGMPVKEKIKAYAKILGKPLIAEIGTLIFISNGHTFDEKQKTVLKKLLNDYSNGTAQYSNTVKKLAGEDTHRSALRQMVKNDPNSVLLYDKKSRQYIETTIEACLIDDDMECYIVDLPLYRGINIGYNEK